MTSKLQKNTTKIRLKCIYNILNNTKQKKYKCFY